MKHPYYPALDGLRTVAVGIVLCAHGGVPWFRSGGVGVDVFFVLSGFLITTILRGEWARTGAISFRNFYARRFLRLAPALLLTCALVGVAKPLFGEPFPGTDILLALSYTANWAQALYGYYMTWLNHCWSLAIEEQFYLLWPLVIVGLERTGRSMATKCLLLFSGAAVIAIYRAWHVGTWTDERLNFGLDTRMDSLMVGAALSYWVAAWANTPRRCAPPLSRGDHEPNRSPLERGPGAVVSAEAAAQGAGCVGAARRGSAGAEPSTAEPRPSGSWALPGLRVLAPLALVTLFMIPRIVTWYSPWMGWIGYVIVAGLAATVLLDLVVSAKSHVARLLGTRPMIFIGKISYGLYLLHLPVFFAVEKVIPHAPLVERLGWKVAISLTLATASYHLVEKRFLALKGRFET